MKSILKKCTVEDFSYLSKILDSYVSLTNDSRRKELLEQYKNNPNPEIKKRIN